MARFKVTGVAEVEVCTFVEAKNEDEAEKKVSERELDLCIHGSEMIEENENEWQLTDGRYYRIKIDGIDNEEG